MRIGLFGATGAIGRHVLEQALEAGHQVSALTRDGDRLAATPALRVVEGDAGTAATVADVVAGTDAVVSALGPSTNAPAEVGIAVAAITNILDAMHQHGVRRVVALSGAAVEVPGERKAFPDAVASAVVRLFARHVVAAKQREFGLIHASDLDWVAVRPPRVTDGPPTGRYRTGELKLGPRSAISRADLAHFMLRSVTDDTHLRRAPFISY